MNKIYLCIDLKSFYASVECVMRGLDSMTTKLVVADPTRGNGTICLAVSPALKALGVKNRCRVFEIPKELDYIKAKPRMHLYMEYSAKIYGIYLKYISKEDIHIYSIDECFLDVTSYLKLYQKTPYELAKTIIDDVYNSTSIRATCGIGTNLFLAKVALDITAKHASDYIGYLDEDIFKEKIWHHKPITDIWNIGRGIAKRLLKFGVDDLYGVTQLKEEVLYKEFGINAEYLIDHAWGSEPCTIKDIKNYKPQNHSLSQGQVLFSDYSYQDALIIVKEMVELICLDLVDKHLVTNGIALYVGYSKDVDKSVNVSKRIDGFTSSYQEINQEFIKIYEENVNPNLLIRRINIALLNVVDEINESFNLFTDTKKREKEKRVMKTINDIKQKYGKNSIVKAMDLQEKATTISRNKMVGGHNGD